LGEKTKKPVGLIGVNTKMMGHIFKNQEISLFL
jgi:hypothetical protein